MSDCWTAKKLWSDRKRIQGVKTSCGVLRYDEIVSERVLKLGSATNVLTVLSENLDQFFRVENAALHLIVLSKRIINLSGVLM